LSAWLLDPRLAQCRRIFLRRIAVSAQIGVHAAERAGPQRLLLDVDLFVRLGDSTPSADALEEVVDYDFVRTMIHERVARGHINLQETLVDELLAGLLAHPKVVAARITSEKPDVYRDVGAVGIEVLRFKDA
jgi:dihydroneopterin aldolase